jgi:hypothetical protein
MKDSIHLTTVPPMRFPMGGTYPLLAVVLVIFYSVFPIRLHLIP